VTDAKIQDVTAAKITTGTLNATETITSEGVIRAVDDVANPVVQVGIGPATFGTATTYLMWAYNGTDRTFSVDELGNVSVTGSITIAAGSTGVANLSDAGTLATKNQADSTDVTFNYADSGSKGGNAKDTDSVNGQSAGVVRSDAEAGATFTSTDAGDLATLNSVDWNSTLDNIPDRVSDTATTGLNLTDTYIGYYDGAAFKSYIQSNGNFHFGETANNFIDFNGTQLVIDTDNFSVDAAGNATFSGDITGSTITGGVVRTSVSGKRVELDGASNTSRVYTDAGLLVSMGEAQTIDGSSVKVAVYADPESLGVGFHVPDDTIADFGVYVSGVLQGVNGRSQDGTGVIGITFSTQSIDYGIKGVGLNGASGVQGMGSVYDFYASGPGANYGPFTGAHDGLLPKTMDPDAGDIVCSTGVFEKSTLSNTIPYLRLSDVTYSKAAYGVFVLKLDLGDELPAALSLLTDTTKISNIKENYDRSIANALGEGQINVCSASGDFEVGDFICTSNTAGKGMRYDGQDMRYVVAKCMEPVVWTDEPANIKMVACIYMCG